MEKIQAAAKNCRIAQVSDKVLNSECCYTFHTPFTTNAGILVNLQTFMGTCSEMTTEPGLYVRIVKERVPKPPAPVAAAVAADGTEDVPMDAEGGETALTAAQPTKLGIGIDGGFQSEADKYDIISTHSIVLLENNAEGKAVITVELPYMNETKTTFPDQVSLSADSVLCHAGMTLQQDVKSWQLDTEPIPVSKYSADLPFVDNGVKISPNPADWKCQKSGSTENLWLNLSTGYIGGGRQNWDGSGGSNGALDHYHETGRQYPLVVKLGTITSDLDTADCYSYAEDEDGPVKVPQLKQLLEKRGIQVANLQKTEKSTAELEVELNATYAFDAITESGSQLQAVSGPGLQGMQNLGNSCYINSAVQMIFSITEFAHRYGIPPGTPLSQHALLKVPATAAPTDVLCQTTKIASALTSGVFARPLDGTADETDPKYRLAARMFKHCIAKDHVDFSTGQQQDAALFLQYFLERLDQAESSRQFSALSSHLFSFATTQRLVCTADQRVKYKTGAPEIMWSLRIPMDKAVVVEDAVAKQDKENEDASATIASPEQKRLKADNDDKEPVRSIALTTCIEEWANETIVQGMRWPHLQNETHAARQKMTFSNFPRYVLVQMQRYQLGPDWQPIKLQVNLTGVEEELDLTSYKSTGPQNGEQLVPEDPPEGENTKAAAAVPAYDEVALGQLMDMGFSSNGCKRALVAVGGSDVEAAMGWILEHDTDPDFNDPLPEGGGGHSDSMVDEEVLQTLTKNLGCFSLDHVRAALKQANGAADQAADWLFTHMDDLDTAVASLQVANSTSTNGQSGASKNAPVLEDGVGKYTLMGMISHIGKHTGSGHYVAHLKKNGQWCIFNDEKVAISSEPPFAHAYVYLYQRIDTLEEPNPNY